MSNSNSPDTEDSQLEDTEEISNEDIFNGVNVPNDIFDVRYYQSLERSDNTIIDGIQNSKYYYSVIKKEPLSGKLIYEVNYEAVIDDHKKKILKDIKKPVEDELEKQAEDSFKNKEEKKEFIMDIVDKNMEIQTGDLKYINKGRKLLSRSGLDRLGEKSLEILKQKIIHDKVEYGKISPLFKDPDIEDIRCPLGPESPIHIFHAKYGWMITNIAFDESELDNFVRSLANRSNRTISKSQPMLDATLPDGSRLNATYKDEVTPNGTTFVIRKYNEERLTPVDLIQYETFTAEQMAFIWFCVEHNKGIFSVGGTGAGKTTTMNAVLMFVPPSDNIVSIEDTPELDLEEANWTNMVTKNAMNEKNNIKFHDLVKNGLRMRPSYMPVGEARDEVVQEMFNAMKSDHTVTATFHSDNFQNFSSRLETHGVKKDEQVSLDLVCFQDNLDTGRRMRKLIEVIGYTEKDKTVKTNTIWKYDAQNDTFDLHLEQDILNTQIISEIKRSEGYTDDRIKDELEVRKEILQYMVDKNATDSEKVTEVIDSYYRHNRNEDNTKENKIYKMVSDPDKKLKTIKGDIE